MVIFIHFLGSLEDQARELTVFILSVIFEDFTPLKFGNG